MYAECLSPYTPMSSKQAIKKDYFIQSRTDSIQKNYKFYPKVQATINSADRQRRIRDSLPSKDDATALRRQSSQGDPKETRSKPPIPKKRIHDPQKIRPSQHR